MMIFFFVRSRDRILSFLRFRRRRRKQLPDTFHRQRWEVKVDRAEAIFGHEDILEGIHEGLGAGIPAGGPKGGILGRAVASHDREQQHGAQSQNQTIHSHLFQTIPKKQINTVCFSAAKKIKKIPPKKREGVSLAHINSF